MGVSISCPFAEYNDVESKLESVVVKSINFGNDEVKTPVRSVSFKGHDTEPTILKSSGSGNMVVEGSVSFKESELKKVILDRQSSRPESSFEMIRKLSILDPSNPEHEAAIKLQKVYKSFRTRRKLADCAVLVEQSWWKLLDFAELKRSSISFFDIEKHETAISRWSRARTRAAKVGKGLSKNDKAQKLALQHWLEAIDPRHRYGHNLHFYYRKWLHCQSREPFFYWLDIGEGKEVNLEKCPRSKLQQQCIKYLGPMERKAYEVVVEDGKFLYKQTGELLHTDGGIKDKWIFVLSTSKVLYVGKKKKGTFQHSSFLAGGATIAAGRLVVENGILKAVWPHSGHYRPTEENFRDFQSFLRENNVDLSDVKMRPTDDEEESLSQQRSSSHLRTSSYEEDITEKFISFEPEETYLEDPIQVKNDLIEHKSLEKCMSGHFNGHFDKLADINVPKPNISFEGQENENEAAENNCKNYFLEYPSKNFETEEAPDLREGDVAYEEHNENEVVLVPEESILQRINSHKELKSMQLGRQLSCKWTTGAGPRIGCVRDYPSELQFQALEQVHLSPRGSGHSKVWSCRCSSGPTSNVSTPRSVLAR